MITRGSNLSQVEALSQGEKRWKAMITWCNYERRKQQKPIIYQHHPRRKEGKNRNQSNNKERKMRVSALVFVALIGSVEAFSTSPSSSRSFSSSTKTVATATTSYGVASSCLYSTAEAAETDSTAAAAAAEDDETEDSADAASTDEDIMIPTNLPSDVGMDYIPLATMLATGQFEEADQVRECEKWKKRRKTI
jgi:hypothetical protein